MGKLVLILFCAFALWMIRRDIARRDGLSKAIWIPTLWAWIILSKPMSLWLGTGGGVDTLEGSPVDRLFFLSLIIGAILVLFQRGLDWPAAISRNWQIFFFYGFFLLSVGWAYSAEASFKRWFKDIGNVAIALVILTESNPFQAIRAVFWRCSLVLFPLSVIFIRWFPDLGRRYSHHSGGLEVVGVTSQKNELGPMIVVCGLILLWDWLEGHRELERHPQTRLDRYVTAGLLASGLYLIYLSDSKTSIVCLLVGAIVLFSQHIPFLRARISALGGYVLIGSLCFFLLENLFGITESIVTSLGRDMTFTGRTNVWREILSLNTDPLIGVGFCSFWSDPRYVSQLPEWIAFSAHNGYMEMYLDGGWLGVAALSILLLVTAKRLSAALTAVDRYSLLRFATLLAIIIGCFSESHFGRMSPLWFLFLLVAIEPSSLRTARQSSGRRAAEGDQQLLHVGL